VIVHEVRIVCPDETSFSFVTPDESGALNVYNLAYNEHVAGSADLLSDGAVVASTDPQRVPVEIHGSGDQP